MPIRVTPVQALLGAVCASFLVAGCATGNNPDIVRQSNTQRAQSIDFGVVTNSRAVTIQGSTTLGTTSGAVIGGALGSNLGSSSSSNTVGALGGAVAGGFAGNAIQGSANQRQGAEITVRLDSGRTMAVVQEGSPNAFRNGDRVRVSSDGHTTRVTRE